MKIFKKYHCPTCTKTYLTQEEAEKCKQSHQVFSHEWVSCDICGREWCIEPFGWGKLGIKRAEQCEKSHKLGDLHGEHPEQKYSIYSWKEI